MASLGHVAVGLAAAHVYEQWSGDRRHRMLRGMACGGLSLLPDADVIGFRLGVAYGAPFGHRGATHSLTAAIGLALIAFLVAWWLQRRKTGHSGAMGARRSSAAGMAFAQALVVLACVGSHGPLDALTDGGKGVALLWPWSDGRFFAPWRPIPVAPIGSRMLSHRGLVVAVTELVYFMPLFVYSFWPSPRRPQVTVERAAD